MTDDQRPEGAEHVGVPDEPAAFFSDHDDLGAGLDDAEGTGPAEGAGDADVAEVAPPSDAEIAVGDAPLTFEPVEPYQGTVPDLAPGEPGTAGAALADLVAGAALPEGSAGFGAYDPAAATDARWSTDRFESIIRDTVDAQAQEQKQLEELLRDVRTALTALPEAGADASAAQATLAEQIQRLGTELDAARAEQATRFEALAARIEEVAATATAAPAGPSIQDLHDGLAGVRTDMTALPDQIGPAVTSAVVHGIAETSAQVGAVQQSLADSVGETAQLRELVAEQSAQVALLPDAVSGLHDLSARVAGLELAVTAAAERPVPEPAPPIGPEVGAVLDERLGHHLGDLRSGLDERLGQHVGDLRSGLDERLGQQLGELRSGLDQQLGELRSGLDERLGQHVGDLRSGLDERLGQQLGELRSGLDQQLGELRSGLDERLGQHVGDLRSGLDQQLGELRSGLDQQLGELRTGIDEQLGRRLSDVRSGMDERLDGLEQRLTALQPPAFDPSALDGRFDGLREDLRALRTALEAPRPADPGVLAHLHASEQRLAHHVDEAVLALAQAVLRRRSGGSVASYLGEPLVATPEPPAPVFAPEPVVSPPAAPEPAPEPAPAPEPDLHDDLTDATAAEAPEPAPDEAIAATEGLPAEELAAAELDADSAPIEAWAKGDPAPTALLVDDPNELPTDDEVPISGWPTPPVWPADVPPADPSVVEPNHEPTEADPPAEQVDDVAGTANESIEVDPIVPTPDVLPGRHRPSGGEKRGLFRRKA